MHPLATKHQEQLAHTLLGDLSPMGAYPNTQLHEPSGKKEFTDLVLYYEFGTILLESKALSIFENRATLPNREKLVRNVNKSMAKAFKQLSVAARKLREGVPVFDENGELIDLERTHPVHAVILVPELDLLASQNDEWPKKVFEFGQKTGGFLHVLDTIQLFRMMQAAKMIADASNEVTPMRAFDDYLIERAKTISQGGPLNLDMILRLQ